ncbi:non-ribosomal peptide synthetase, partial [Stigmatella aurantiaca]
MMENPQDSKAGVPLSGSRFVPCSLLQEHVWNFEQVAGSGGACVQGGFRISGALEVPLLERSLDALIQRHQILRTRFALVEGTLAQIVEDAGRLPLTVIELARADEAALKEVALEQARRPFDPGRGPLLRAVLLHLGVQEHVLLLCMHRLIADEASFGVLGRELATLYSAFSAGRAPRLPEPSQYGEFAEKQRSSLRGEALDLHLHFWKQKFSGATPIQLPTDFHPPQAVTGVRARHSFVLPRALVEALRALAPGEADSLRDTLLAAFRLLLHRHAYQQEDTSIGLLVSHAPDSGGPGLLGPVASPLVLRLPLSGNPAFHSFRRSVRKTLAEALAHRALPFETLLDVLQLGPERGPELLRALVIFEAPAPEFLQLPELSFVPLETQGGVTPCELVLRLSEGLCELRGAFEYNAELFQAATISRMVERFERLLEGIAATPDQRVLALPLLTRQEHHQIHQEWNPRRVERREESAHGLFEEQVRRTPEAVAVSFEEEEVTYGELEKRANQVANYLRGKGVGPESRVGVCVERSVELVVGMLGTLKAGGAYVPLDPSVPAERLGYMVEDSGLEVLLTQAHLEGKLPQGALRVVRLDADWGEIGQQSQGKVESGSGGGNLAYVIYTSGSTGKPKGTLLEHGGLCNTVREAIEMMELGPGKRVLQFSSMGFDASVWEMFSALLSGARLEMAPKEALQPGAPLQELLKQKEITTATLTPAVLMQLEPRELPKLKTVAAA